MGAVEQVELVNRDLDGVYFRVERNGKWCNRCFTDLTKEEKDSVLDGRSREWLKSMCMILADRIREIGDLFDLYGGYEDENY